MTATHVLVVDDDIGLCQTVGEYLTLHGFTVDTATDGPEMRRHFWDRQPDLVILDLALPGEDGLTLARWLRQQGDVAIVMLTGSSETIDRIVGLELGADDYIGKPFIPRELLARVRAVVRRLDKSSLAEPMPDDSLDANRIRAGTKWLDIDAHELIDDEGFLHPITPIEFLLLKHFVENPNRIITRERLLAIAEARDKRSFERAIDVRITRLRRKIEVDPQQPKYITTVRGTGYRFVPDGGA